MAVINRGDELEGSLAELTKRGVIRGWWAERRMELNAVVVRVAYHNNKYQEWMINENVIRQEGAVQAWTDSIVRSILRENENSAMKIITDSMAQAVTPMMMYKDAVVYGAAVAKVSVPVEQPKEEPKSNGIVVTVAAYRLDTIEFIVEGK